MENSPPFCPTVSVGCVCCCLPVKNFCPFCPKFMNVCPALRSWWGLGVSVHSVLWDVWCRAILKGSLCPVLDVCFVLRSWWVFLSIESDNYGMCVLSSDGDECFCPLGLIIMGCVCWDGGGWFLSIGSDDYGMHVLSWNHDGLLLSIMSIMGHVCCLGIVTGGFLSILSGMGRVCCHLIVMGNICLFCLAWDVCVWCLLSTMMGSFCPLYLTFYLMCVLPCDDSTTFCNPALRSPKVNKQNENKKEHFLLVSVKGNSLIFKTLSSTFKFEEVGNAAHATNLFSFLFIMHTNCFSIQFLNLVSFVTDCSRTSCLQ